jgi:hypothetical protein
VAAKFSRKRGEVSNYLFALVPSDLGAGIAEDAAGEMWQLEMECKLRFSAVHC